MFDKILKLTYFASEKNSRGFQMALAWLVTLPEHILQILSRYITICEYMF